MDGSAQQLARRVAAQSAPVIERLPPADRLTDRRRLEVEPRKIHPAAVPMTYRDGPPAPALSILVPVYNERSTIRTVIENVRAVTFGKPVEIIVVDDGSTDGTRDVLAKLPSWDNVRVFLHEKNTGKGGAIQTAIRHVRSPILVIQDADLELDPQDLLPLWQVVSSGKSSVCFGSRFMRGTGSMWKLPTYWANRFLNLICNLVNGIHISDMNTCYKMMRTDVARRIKLTSRGFAMEPEITTKLARLGVRIAEQPIGYRPRSRADGKKIRAKELTNYLLAMARFRFSKL